MQFGSISRITIAMLCSFHARELVTGGCRWLRALAGTMCLAAVAIRLQND